MPDTNNTNTLSNIKGKKITAHDSYYDVERDDDAAYLIVGYSKNQDRDNYKLSLTDLYEAFEDKISERISEIIANETKAFNIDYGTSRTKFDITYQGSSVLPPMIKAYESIELTFKPKGGYKVISESDIASWISGCAHEEHLNEDGTATVILSKPTGDVSINAKAAEITYNINIFYKYQIYNADTESYEDAGGDNGEDFDTANFEASLSWSQQATIDDIIQVINSNSDANMPSPNEVTYTISASYTGITITIPNNKKKASTQPITLKLNENIKNTPTNLSLHITIKAMKSYLVGFIYHNMLTSITDQNDNPFFDINDTTGSTGLAGDPKIYNSEDETPAITLKKPFEFYQKLLSIDTEKNSDLFGSMLHYYDESELSLLKDKTFNLYTPNQIKNNWGGRYSEYDELVNDPATIEELGDKNYVWLICPIKNSNTNNLGLELKQKQSSYVYDNTLYLPNNVKRQFTGGLNYPIEIYSSTQPAPTSKYRIGGVDYYMIPLLIETQTIINITQKS